MRVLYWLITAPLLVFAASFAISNRDNVSLSLWPLPFEITVPIAAVGLIGILFGAIVGMLLAWANAGKTRSRARSAEREAESKGREIAQLREELQNLRDVPSPSTLNSPALETKAISDS